jgi:hypothetical protein
VHCCERWGCSCQLSYEQCELPYQVVTSMCILCVVCHCSQACPATFPEMVAH